jgi:hypothetical protein
MSVGGPRDSQLLKSVCSTNKPVENFTHPYIGLNENDKYQCRTLTASDTETNGRLAVCYWLEETNTAYVEETYTAWQR